MDAIHLLCLYILCIACSVSAQSPMTCDVTSDCGSDDKCCVSRWNRDFRRRSREDWCDVLGTRDGARCQAATTNGEPARYCPCGDGLECVLSQRFRTRFGRCRPIIPQCTSSDDCEDDECCMSASLRLRIRYGRINICQPISSDGDVCTSDPVEQPDIYGRACPCADGLSCENGSTRRRGRCRPIVTRCTSSDDCEDDECCMTTSYSFLLRIKYGRVNICQPIASTGDVCSPNPFEEPDIYARACPCADGLTCDPSNRRSRSRPGVCIAESVAVTVCSGPDDCAPDECCINPMRPIGKKKRQARQGHCASMSGNGARCLVNNGAGRPTTMVFVSCPCESGLVCDGIGQRDRPLGEIGECRDPPPPPCESDADCDPTDCCINPNVKGRRKRQAGNTCNPRGNAGDRCPFGGPSPHICPCTTGLTCVDAGFEEVPQGPIGACTP